MQNDTKVQGKSKSRKNILILAIVLVVCLVVGIVAVNVLIRTPWYQNRKYLKTARKAFKEEEYEDAMEAYQDAIRVWGRNKSAIQKEMAKQYSPLPKQYDQLVSEAMEDKNYEKAEKLYDRGMEICECINNIDYEYMDELNSDDYMWLMHDDIISMYIILGNTEELLQNGQYEDAFESYADVLQQTKHKSSDYAETIMKQAVEGMESSTVAMAKQYILQGTYNWAKERYEVLLEKVPDSVAAYRGLSDLRLYQDDPVGACEMLDQGIEAGCDREHEGAALAERKEYIINNVRVVRRREYKDDFLEYSCEFDEQGRLTASQYRSTYDGVTPDGYNRKVLQNFYTNYQYDEAGRVAEISSKEQSDANAPDRTKYKYDEKGRLTEKIDDETSGYGHFLTSNTYTYNEDDYVTEHIYTKQAEDSEEVTTEKESMTFDDNGKITEYVKAGRDGKTEILRFDEKGRLTYKKEGNTEYLYDDAGVETECIQYSDDGEVIKRQVYNEQYNALGFPISDFYIDNYIYDDLGRIVSTKSGYGGVEYDDQNRIIHTYDYGANQYSAQKYRDEYVKVTYDKDKGYESADYVVATLWDVYYTYDDLGRLSSIKTVANQYKIIGYKKESSYVDSSGIDWRIADRNKCYSVPEFRWEEKTETKNYQYVECDEAERINGTEAVFRGLRERGGPGFMCNPRYYLYTGNWKFAEGSDTFSFTVANDESQKHITTASQILELAPDPAERDKSKMLSRAEEADKKEFDYFGNLTYYQKNQNSEVKERLSMEYQYQFVGEIE